MPDASTHSICCTSTPEIAERQQERRRARRSGPFVSFALRLDRYASATRTVRTDGASFRFGTRTVALVETDRSTTRDTLPLLPINVMRSFATFEAEFTRTVRYLPAFVLMTRAETSCTFATFAGATAFAVA